MSRPSFAPRTLADCIKRTRDGLAIELPAAQRMLRELEIAHAYLAGMCVGAGAQSGADSLDGLLEAIEGLRRAIERADGDAPDELGPLLVD